MVPVESRYHTLGACLLLMVGVGSASCDASQPANDSAEQRTNESREDAGSTTLVEERPVGPEPAGSDFEKELFITDPRLVDSPRATEWSGASSDDDWRDGTFHFARLMNDMIGRDGDQQGEDGAPPVEFEPYPLSTFINRWLDEIEIDDKVNCDVVAGRPRLKEQLRDVWPKAVPATIDRYRTRVGDSTQGAQSVDRETLDVRKPPFRLLAVVFRPDLADLTPPRGPQGIILQSDPPQAGELRLVYGLVGRDGSPKNYTVAFEYSIPARNEDDVTRWQRRWHSLVSSTTLGSDDWLNAISKLVWEVTRNNGARTSTNLFPESSCLGCGQARPHDNNLHQIRTNDYKVLGPDQEFREFRIPITGGSQGNAGGAPDHFYLNRTFSARFLSTDKPKLANYLKAYCEHVAEEHHKVPQDFPAFASSDDDRKTCDAVQTANSVQAGSISNTMDREHGWWDVDLDAIDGCGEWTKNEIRHRFSRNTCNGCHGYEMGFRTDTAENNFMVRPRRAGEASTLSPLLQTGEYRVTDPKTGAERIFKERWDRRLKYARTLRDGYEQPAYPTWP
jgi:hypothetical protein